jgi:CRP/FNR family cyclic AMP-dependent transcriptional regulator
MKSGASLTRAAAALHPDVLLHALGKTPLFVQFSESELRRLASSARPRTYRDGEIVFQKDDPGTGLYVILSGTIKISIMSTEGEETLIALLGHDECFGEMAVLDGRPRSATATAMDRAETLHLPRDGFLQFLGEHPEAMRKIILVLSQRLRDTDEDLADSSSRTSTVVWPSGCSSSARLTAARCRTGSRSRLR